MVRLPSRAQTVALAPAAVLAIVFAVSLPADPVRGFTASASPFTDEVFTVLNARNFVLLGRWSTDDWNLHLVNFPLSAAMAASFALGGVGLLQARVVTALATVVMVAALGVGLRRHVGLGPAVLAAAALAATPLLVFYGRLAYHEDAVAMFLVLAALSVPMAAGPRPGRFGLLAGSFLAAAVGVKPSALFAVVGLLGGVLLAAGLRGSNAPAVRRWVLAAGLALAVAAVGWLLLIGLPNRAAIEVDFHIWPTERVPTSLRQLAGRAIAYFTHSDGAVPLTVALLVGGGGGVAAALAFRRRVSSAQWLLLAAAVGWLVAGIGILLAVQYRPNRYLVPMLPALAIMLAVGMAAVRRQVSATGDSPRAHRAPRRAELVAIAVAAVALVAPGAVLAARFAAQPSTLPAFQEQALRVGIDTPVVGRYAPLFVMRVPQPAIVAPWPGVNLEDQYATRGARWVLAGENGATLVPGWVTAHPAAWAARRTAACYSWNAERWCLYQLP